MKVLKFGGTSVANAENINKVVHIVVKNDEAQIVVVSALGGVTDTLIKAGTLASGSYNYSLYVDGKIIDTKRMVLTK